MQILIPIFSVIAKTPFSRLKVCSRMPREVCATICGRDGRIEAATLDREQRAAHGLAWYATYVEALRQMVRWARGSNTKNASAKSRS